MTRVKHNRGFKDCKIKPNKHAKQNLTLNLRSRKRRDVKSGDKVLFGKWSGTEVKIDGKEVLIMKESDTLGVIENLTRSTRLSARD